MYTEILHNYVSLPHERNHNLLKSEVNKIPTPQNRTEQNRTEQNRTEQNRTEQNRTEQESEGCFYFEEFVKSLQIDLNFSIKLVEIEESSLYSHGFYLVIYS